MATVEATRSEPQGAESSSISQSRTAPPNSLRRAARCGNVFLGALGLFCLLSGLACWLPWDEVLGGMWLTYPPRSLLLAIAMGCCVWCIAQRRYALSGVLLLAMAGLFHSARHADVTLTSDKGQLRMLAFNVHDCTDHAEDFAEVCTALEIDLLCLQEVKPESRVAFETALADYVLIHADEEQEFEYSRQGPFSSIIGIKRELLTETSPEVLTAITGYRTFAARLQTTSGPLTVVNVHTTKSFHTGAGITGLWEALTSKAERHRLEHDRLQDWLDEQPKGVPLVVAGDFNAPPNSYNVRYQGLHAATLPFPSIPLSFPRGLPIWGIDHTLANAVVRFSKYQLLDLRYSDHCAQYCEFQVPAAERPY